MREGFRKSVHFPPAPEKAGEYSRAEFERDQCGETGDRLARPNAGALGLYAETLRDTEIIRERLRGLLTTQSRHGDLQAALSAARRLAEKLQSLIEHEERS